MDVEYLLRAWDGECVIIHYECTAQAWIIIAVHSTRLGPADGGTRLMSYPAPEEALQDALRLSAGMSCKYAVADFPCGGGKAIIAVPPDAMNAQTRKRLLRSYGALLNRLGGLFHTGPDVGTTSEDMDVIAETGGSYVEGCSKGAGVECGPAALTALGVLEALRVVCGFLYGDEGLESRSFVVQGLGKVGRPLVEHLLEVGAEVAVSDQDANTAARICAELGVRALSADEVYTAECDVFVPCALGQILNARTIPLLRCRAVAGAANNQLHTPEDANRLHARGILYAPDFVVNLGGAIGGTGMERMGWSHDYAAATVVTTVGSTLTKVLASAAAQGISPDGIARRLAQQRLAKI